MTDFSKGVHKDFSGWKIEAAATSATQKYLNQLAELKVLIGGFISDDAEDWAANCWVSDMSTLWDFMLDQDDLAELSKTLGFPVTKDMYLYQVCALMYPAEVF